MILTIKAALAAFLFDDIEIFNTELKQYKKIYCLKIQFYKVAVD